MRSRSFPIGLDHNPLKYSIFSVHSDFPSGVVPPPPGDKFWVTDVTNRNMTTDSGITYIFVGS